MLTTPPATHPVTAADHGTAMTVGEGGLDLLFRDLGGERALLLAVSGGPDSMALLRLAWEWARGLALAPSLHVATVDHGLRVGSAAEAAVVAEAAARLGLAHARLEWLGPKPATRVQERARDARYALLAAHAASVGATHILTAHHADDQAETVLMRLGRGSGIAGLAGMRRFTPLAGGVVLARPLLAVTKAELVAVCRRTGTAFVEDPSNGNQAYARVRLRASASSADALGLDRAALLRLGRRAAAVEDALEAATVLAERALAPVFASGGCEVVLGIGDPLAGEILRRLLRQWAARLVPGRVARLDRLERLAAEIATAVSAGTACAATLAGCRFRLRADGRLRIERERRRLGARAAERPD